MQSDDVAGLKASMKATISTAQGRSQLLQDNELHVPHSTRQGMKPSINENE